MKLVLYGVDTLILNVHYSDDSFQPVKKELDEGPVRELAYLQSDKYSLSYCEFLLAAIRSNTSIASAAVGGLSTLLSAKSCACG